MKNFYKLIKIFFVCILLLVYLPASYLLAKDNSGNISLDYDWERDQGTEKLIADNFLVPGYGLILNTYNISDKENDLLSVVARPWLKLNLGKNVQLYLRGKNDYNTFLKKDEFVEKSAQNTLDLDLGYLSYEKDQYRVYLGRQYVQLGQGLLLDSRADGINAEYNLPLLRVKLISVYSGLLKKDYNPFNLSNRDYTEGADRFFLGLSLGFSFYAQSLDLIFLNETDFAKEVEGIADNYSVNYFGLSAAGNIFAQLYYSFEGYLETGKSQVNGTPEKSKVQAFGQVARLYYFLPKLLQSRIFLEYAFGSGDPDRDSAVSPIGNQAGTDKGFIHFGTFQSGLGLRPYLSNLHVVDLGVSFFPLIFARERIWRDIQLMFKVLRYQKDKSPGGINYGEATADSNNVGTGLDIYLGWRVSAELSLVATYGFFSEGDAYAQDKRNRHLFLAGFNFSI